MRPSANVNGALAAEREGQTPGRARTGVTTGSIAMSERPIAGLPVHLADDPNAPCVHGALST